MGISKVAFADGTVKMDITDSTVTPETLAEGAVAYGSDGERIIGVAPRVDITQYYTKTEVDELVAKAIAEAMGTNGGGYFWKSVKEE